MEKGYGLLDAAALGIAHIARRRALPTLTTSS